MPNTIKEKWWNRMFAKMNKFASRIMPPNAKERYKVQEDFDAEKKNNGTTKTNKAG